MLVDVSREILPTHRSLLLRHGILNLGDFFELAQFRYLVHETPKQGMHHCPSFTRVYDRNNANRCMVVSVRPEFAAVSTWTSCRSTTKFCNKVINTIVQTRRMLRVVYILAFVMDGTLNGKNRTNSSEPMKLPLKG